LQLKKLSPFPQIWEEKSNFLFFFSIFFSSLLFMHYPHKFLEWSILLIFPALAFVFGYSNIIKNTISIELLKQIIFSYFGLPYLSIKVFHRICKFARKINNQLISRFFYWFSLFFVWSFIRLELWFNKKNESKGSNFGMLFLDLAWFVPYVY